MVCGLERSHGIWLPPGHLRSLVTKGIIDGVGGVLGSYRSSFSMFLGIALLEDWLPGKGSLHAGSRLPAFRASWQFLHGLHRGRRKLPADAPFPRSWRPNAPQFQGSACDDPSVPFMNCGAKLPVYAPLCWVRCLFLRKRSPHDAFADSHLLVDGVPGRKTSPHDDSSRAPQHPFSLELPPLPVCTPCAAISSTPGSAPGLYKEGRNHFFLAVSILFWALMNFPELPESEKAAFDAKREALCSRASPRPSCGRPGRRAIPGRICRRNGGCP
jgi:ferrous iron transport protein B